LFTGAQAASLDFGPGDAVAPNSVNFSSISQPPGNFNMIFFVPQSGPASFNGLSGTFTFSGPTSPTVVIPVSGTSGTFILGNNLQTFIASFGSDSLTGTVVLTEVQENNFNATLIGEFDVTFSAGDATFVSSFSGGTADAFQLALDCASCVRTLSQTAAGGVADTYTVGLGSITSAAAGAPPEIPLPPAIYLFGSVLGGAFWLGRRKRSAVSGLGSA
jgi:hypothetical protein